MKPLVELELRKNLVTVLTLGACCTLLPMLAALASMIPGSGDMPAFGVYTQAFMLCASALILGGMSGAACRRDRAIEEVAPQNYARQIFAALGAAMLAFSSMAAFSQAALQFASAYCGVQNGMPLFASLAVDFSLLTFTFVLSYMLETPATAATLAVMLLAPNLGALLIGRVLDTSNIYGGTPLSIAAMISAVPAMVALALILSRTMLRNIKMSLKQKFAAGLLIVLPTLCGIAAYINTYNLFEHALLPQEEIPLLSADANPAPGVVAQTLCGVEHHHDTYFLASSGKRVRLVEMFINNSIFDNGNIGQPGIFYFFTPSGEIWLHDADNGEMLNGTPDKPLGSSGIIGWGNYNYVAAAYDGREYELYAHSEATGYEANLMLRKPQYYLGEQPQKIKDADFYAMTVKFTPAEFPVVAKSSLQKDGAPAPAAYRRLPGGGFGAYLDGKLYSMTQSRAKNAVFAINLAPSDRVLHAEAGKVHILTGDKLVVYDTASGLPEKSVRLHLAAAPEKYPSGTRVCADGVFVFNRGMVMFYNWNGDSLESRSQRNGSCENFQRRVKIQYFSRAVVKQAFHLL
jgi:hypothetical protein